MMGALQENLWWAVFGGSGIVLGAAYMLWLYQRTMFGKIENPANENLLDLNAARTGDHDSADHHGILDWSVSGAVLPRRWISP